MEYGIVEGDVTEEDICYRQFYVLSIGFPEDVQRFCQSLIKNMDLKEGDIESAVFYEEPIYGLDYTDFNRYHFQDDSSGGYLRKEGYVIVNDDAKMSIYGWGKKSVEGKDIVVSYRVEGVSLQKQLESGPRGVYSLPDVGELELNEVPYRIEEKKVYMWIGDKESFNEVESYAGVYQIENVFYSPEEKLIYVWFKVFEKNIPKSTLKLSCRVVLENMADLGDDWVEQWEVKNEKEDCGKTKKLGEFFDALKEKMPEVNKTLLDFVFYLNY